MIKKETWTDTLESKDKENLLLHDSHLQIQSN